VARITTLAIATSFLFLLSVSNVRAAGVCATGANAVEKTMEEYPWGERPDAVLKKVMLDKDAVLDPTQYSAKELEKMANAGAREATGNPALAKRTARAYREAADKLSDTPVDTIRLLGQSAKWSAEAKDFSTAAQTYARAGAGQDALDVLKNNLPVKEAASEASQIVEDLVRKCRSSLGQDYFNTLMKEGHVLTPAEHANLWRANRLNSSANKLIAFIKANLSDFSPEAQRDLNQILKEQARQTERLGSYSKRFTLY